MRWKRFLSKFLVCSDRILVRAGDVFPIDGVITHGETYINNSLLTGEVMPEKASVGDDVFMGAKNLDRDLVLDVTSKFEDSRFGKILNEIEQGWKIRI